MQCHANTSMATSCKKLWSISSGILSGDLLVAITMRGYSWGVEASFVTHLLKAAMVRGSGREQKIKEIE